MQLLGWTLCSPSLVQLCLIPCEPVSCSVQYCLVQFSERKTKRFLILYLNRKHAWRTLGTKTYSAGGEDDNTWLGHSNTIFMSTLQHISPATSARLGSLNHPLHFAKDRAKINCLKSNSILRLLHTQTCFKHHPSDVTSKIAPFFLALGGVFLVHQYIFPSILCFCKNKKKMSISCSLIWVVEKVRPKEFLFALDKRQKIAF